MLRAAKQAEARVKKNLPFFFPRLNCMFIINRYSSCCCSNYVRHCDDPSAGAPSHASSPGAAAAAAGLAGAGAAPHACQRMKEIESMLTEANAAKNNQCTFF